MRMFIVTLVVIGLFGVVMAFFPRGERSSELRPVALGTFGDVGEFEFVDQNGETFSSNELQGKVWLAGFVFTSCGAECPILTQKMLDVQAELGESAKANFISFSVDPQTDTPQRLSEYADRFGLPGGWSLLTGDPEKLDTFIKTEFLQPTSLSMHEKQDIASAAFIHTNKLVVVDGAGQIRYFTDGLETGAVHHLAEAMRKLM